MDARYGNFFLRSSHQLFKLLRANLKSLNKLKKKIDKILFSVDDVETGTIKAATGFWSRSSFDTIAPGIANPWRSSTTNMAPFDQEFYLIMNLAIGGNVIFPDDATNAPG